VNLTIHGLSTFAVLQGVVFWLAVLCIVLRMTLSDSNTALLACYESLRLNSYFALILPGQSRSQTRSRAGLTSSNLAYLDS
jgi:hypothetical protein